MNMREKVAAALARHNWEGADFASWTDEAQEPLLSAANAVLDALRGLTEQAWPEDAQFALDEPVQKKGRASWRGHVRGWYRTELTALGFAVESAFEPGSVQIYPQSALLAWTPIDASKSPLLRGDDDG